MVVGVEEGGWTTGALVVYVVLTEVITGLNASLAVGVFLVDPPEGETVEGLASVLEVEFPVSELFWFPPFPKLPQKLFQSSTKPSWRS